MPSLSTVIDQKFVDAEKAKWKQDGDVASCPGCKQSFGFLRRKHHCRRCGGVFCDSCSTARRQLPGWGGDLQRVCDICKSVPSESDFKSLLGLLRQKDQVKEVQTLLEKFSKPDDLRSLLQMKDATNDTALLAACSSAHCDASVIDLLLSKIASVDIKSKALLIEQLTVVDEKGWNALMYAIRHANTPEPIKILLDAAEKCGKETLLSQLDAVSKSKYETPVLITACCLTSTVPKMTCVMSRIVEAGGVLMLEKQLAKTDAGGWNCLMCVCRFSPSVEKIDFVSAKIVECGGRDMLADQFTAANDKGENCLLFICEYATTVDNIKRVVNKIAEAGGDQLVKELLMIDKNKVLLQRVICNVKLVTDDDKQKAWKFFSSLLYVFDLFLKQYAELSDKLKEKLKAEAGIVSTWTPTPAEVAEVNVLVKRRVATVIVDTKANIEDDETELKKTGVEEVPKKVENQQQKPEVIISADSPPPSRCFKRGVPDKNLEDSVRALMSIKEAPSNRPDLDNWLPDKEDAENLLHYLKTSLSELKNRPAIQKLIAENGLTDDDIKVLHSYKIQNPYPVYLWLNGWLGGDRRDDFVKENVAPFFTLLYRAMEKLPRVTTLANRAIKVNGIPALKNTYDNYEKTCAPEQTLSFWGFSSFSTKSDVVNREEFVGKPSEQAIVYSCGKLEGVDMEPFAPKGLKDESEILPLCPCVLEVVTAVKMGQKLVVGVKQLDHANYCYVIPK